MVASVTVSCGKKAATPPVEPPKPQKPLVWGGLGDIETLNPILSESSHETDVMNTIFSTLMKVNQDLELIPDLLAKMPDVSEDGLVFTFELRKGVKFHDGVELTAEDVKFMVDMKMAPGNVVPSRTQWEKIEKFEIKDPYNFVITLKELDVTWLQGWCYSDAMIVPKHILEKEFKAGGDTLTKGGEFSRNPVGSGPYKFVEWKAGEHVLVERFDDYFKGKPQVEKIVFKFLPDTNTMLAQFTAGEIDMYEAQAAHYKELLAMKDKGTPIEVVKFPGFIYLHADFNLRNPVFKEKEVRQALNYAFPKQQFIDTVLDGIGTVAHSDVPEFSWAYNPNVKKYDYNPAKAEELLEAAGWKKGADGIRAKNGVKLAFTMSTNSGNKVRESFQEIAKQEWEKIGAKVDIQNYEAATLFGDILDNIKFDMIIFGWKAGFDPDSTTLWSSKQIPDPNNPEASGQNYVGYVNARVDELLEAGLKEPDLDKRKKIYWEIQEIISEEVPYMFLYFYNTVFAYPSSLKNFKPNPTQANNNWNVWEWELQ